MSEIYDVVKGLRKTGELKQADNKKEIIKLVEEFVNQNVDNNEIPQEIIMDFLGKLGYLLVPFCMNNTFCSMDEVGINENLKEKLALIFKSNGYQPVEEERAYLVDSLLSNHNGFVGYRIGDMGVHIHKEDEKLGILEDPEMLANYAIRNFLYHLQKGSLSSVYYDFNGAYAHMKNQGKSKR